MPTKSSTHSLYFSTIIEEEYPYIDCRCSCRSSADRQRTSLPAYLQCSRSCHENPARAQYFSTIRRKEQPMGRNNDTFTLIVDQHKEIWSKFRRGLRIED